MSAAESNRLLELAATNVGVIEHLGLLFGPGMTAITGETGAGKTLLLTALDLLMGGRAEASVVGPYGDEAVVEARFLFDDEELVLQRIVPKEGRSRAYVNGRLATAANLADYAVQLVELHGQHGHTALTATAAQRQALDLFGNVDLSGLIEARLSEQRLRDQIQALGGDSRARFRELELLRFQVEEIEAADIVSADEDDLLRHDEEMLGGASGHRDAIALAAERLGSDGPAETALSEVLAALEGREIFASLQTQVRDVTAVLADLAAQARELSEQIDDNPQRLAEVQERRRTLTSLRRKYGETLEDVLRYFDQCAQRLVELENHDRLAEELEVALGAAQEATAAAEAQVGAARRQAAPKLAKAIQKNVRELALANARVECAVGDDPGDDVVFRVSMNKGAAVQPLAKIASGGELARTMLALRLVLSADPATMVFDEVDAGVGGAAAQAVGAALAKLGRERQVLVVTHLAQVAAHADNHITVVKDDTAKMVSVNASVIDHEARVVELSRMLSGSPGSQSAQDHAAELLAQAQAQRIG